MCTTSCWSIYHAFLSGGGEFCMQAKNRKHWVVKHTLDFIFCTLEKHSKLWIKSTTTTTKQCLTSVIQRSWVDPIWCVLWTWSQATPVACPARACNPTPRVLGSSAGFVHRRMSSFCWLSTAHVDFRKHNWCSTCGDLSQLVHLSNQGCAASLASQVTHIEQKCPCLAVDSCGT